MLALLGLLILIVIMVKLGFVLLLCHPIAGLLFLLVAGCVKLMFSSDD